MKVKLDENMGRSGLDLLRATGVDAMTVREQGLGGAPDVVLYNLCAAEGRVLINLDHDFGQVLRFSPERSAGVVIPEPGSRVTPRSLLNRLQDVLALADTRSPAGQLWIAEPGRVHSHL